MPVCNIRVVRPQLDKQVDEEWRGLVLLPANTPTPSRLSSRQGKLKRGQALFSCSDDADGGHASCGGSKLYFCSNN
jgi:hypothetical protein